MKPKTLFSPNLTLEQAEELIKNGADINEINTLHFSPLFYIEDLNIFELFIKHGFDINKRHHNDTTLLHFSDNLKVSSYLIKKGADVNARSINNRTVLDYCGNREIAKLLIENGAISADISYYEFFKNLFSKEQQDAFDAFLLLTNSNDQFFEMCFDYQNNHKNNVKIEIKDMDIV